MEAIKVCDNPNGLPVGVPADFTITVENCGDLPIICDDSEGEIGTIPLDPGQSASVPYSASTDDACLNEPYEVSNTTLVTCTASDGTPLESPVSDACDVLCEPCIEVEKDCAETELILEGEPADFNIVIRNCGDIPLEDISITDPAVGPVDPYAGPLGPGEASDPIMVTIDAAQCVDGVVENAVAVSAETPQGQVTDTATDVCPCGTPCVDVEKVCTSTELVVPGGPAAFDIIITNCGDVPLEVISIDDPAVGPVLPAGPLVPGESETVSVVIDEALCVDTDNGFEVENTVTVTSEGETATATDVCPCEEEVGGEGCTPGFWKNNAGIDYNYKNGKNAKLQDNCWCGSYSATTTLGEAFGDIPEPFKSDTMIDGINYTGKGGPEYSMLRHAVAALLNACSSDVVSPLTEAGIKDTVVTALKPGGDIAAAHQEFAEANESRTADTCIADDTTEGTCDNTDKPCEDGKCESYHNCPINSHCELKDEAPVEPFNTYLEMLSSEYGVKCGS
jgi:hypothetical protein